MKNILILSIVALFFTNCGISESDSDSDYFPLRVRNKWSYNFSYQPWGSSGDTSKTGSVSWEIINENKILKEYLIREVIQGQQTVFKIEGSPEQTNFGPDTLETKFYVTEDNWVKILFLSFRLESDSVMIRRYYPNDRADVLEISNQDGLDYNWENIKGDWNFHKIQMQKNIGIKYWKYCCEHHSAPFLELNLIDYNIE